jgi:hypothetical protein
MEVQLHPYEEKQKQNEINGWHFLEVLREKQAGIELEVEFLEDKLEFKICYELEQKWP